MDRSRRRKFIVAAVLLALAPLLVAEGLIRVVYAIRNARVTKIPVPYYAAHTFAELPPWYDGLRSLEPDPELIWRTRPNISREYLDVFSPADHIDERVALERSFIPRVPDDPDRYPTWVMRSNSLGYRDDEFPDDRPPGQLRVLCMGDSWTFSVNADQEQTYPRALEEVLRRAHPGLDVEVLNLGVMGYSSFQGLKLLETTALALEPDVIVIGYGMNDGQLSPWRDEQLLASSRGVPARVARVIKKSEVMMLGRYVGRLLLRGYKPLEKRIEGTARQLAASTVKGGTLPSTRVSPEDYERNVRSMVTTAREHGVDAVLVYNELRGFDGIAPPLEDRYRDALVRIAAGEGVPFVDTSKLLARAVGEIERELAMRLGLRPAGGIEGDGGEGVTVVFRVFEGGHPASERLYIAGAHESLGNAEPNAIAMFDDGTHGDERPGDGVWAWSGTFEPGEALAYVYTNSGRRGEWEGIDAPYVRTYLVANDSGGTVYRPIETFGHVYMQTDANHTGASGYALIAERVAEVVGGLPATRERATR